MAELIDACGRRIDYLRLSVTDRCDLRCAYCMSPDFDDYESPAHWLTIDELERVARIFVTLGVWRIRLTGGEPLLRARIELARRMKGNAGLRDLSLSTNGTQLVHHAARLRAAGVGDSTSAWTHSLARASCKSPDAMRWATCWPAWRPPAPPALRSPRSIWCSSPRSTATKWTP